MRSRRAAVKAQRRTFMLGLMVLTVIVIGSVLLGNEIRTQAAPAEPSYKYYTSIQIRREIPSGISDEYINKALITTAWTNMEEICAINHSCRGTFILTVSDHPVLFGRTSQVRWYFCAASPGRLCFLGKYGIMNSDELILCGKAAQRI